MTWSVEVVRGTAAEYQFVCRDFCFQFTMHIKFQEAIICNLSYFTATQIPFFKYF